MKLRIAPLTPERWADFDALFNSRGCSLARGCWCMYYRRRGSFEPAPAGKSPAQTKRAMFRKIVAAGPAPGLIGYQGTTPVGWVSVSPREDYEKLKRSPVLKPVDDRPVWSIICFVVPSAFRGQGVARALLDGAVAYAAKQGAGIVEAYPVDRPGRSKDENMWFGTMAMFVAVGFREVARRKPERPIVRLDLQGPPAR